jgi:hypothetical protein
MIWVFFLWHIICFSENLNFLISERRIMKVVITLKGNSIDNQPRPRFGRTKIFIIIAAESENMEACRV